MSRLLTDLPLEEQIDRLPTEPDWNAYGAPPVSAAARQRAKQCLRILADEMRTEHTRLLGVPMVGPMPNGGVVLFWRIPPDLRVDVQLTDLAQQLVVLKARRIMQHEAVDLSELPKRLLEALK